MKTPSDPAAALNCTAQNAILANGRGSGAAAVSEAIPGIKTLNVFANTRSNGYLSSLRPIGTKGRS